jgi:hypothetical protein
MPRFSLKDIENARPENPKRLAGTTEEEIQRQIAEDGGFDLGEVDPSRLTARQSGGCIKTSMPKGGAASAMATGAPCSRSTGPHL